MYNLVLISNNKSLFYKYLNDKLHTSNSISPVLCSITNNIVTSDDEKAVCLSRQFSYLFINNNSTSVNFHFIARHTPNINQFSNLNRICRCFITNDYVFLLQAYIRYVRPILEYNSSIWNPHTNYIGNAKAL